jgi:CubicO group peptidase (beta-lactamase class C family)
MTNWCSSIRKLRYCILASGVWSLLLSGCSRQADTVFPAEEWETVAPEAEDLDSAKLEIAVDFLKNHTGKDGVTELLVVRNGRLVWVGENIDHQHGVWSMTKSFTSTILGLLIEDGLCALDTKAASVLPEMGDLFPEVMLQHFTTMTSGYRAVGDDRPGNYRHGPSTTPFVPDTSLLFEPGSKFAYWDSAMNQFANALTHIAGEPLEAVFKRRIADPIGMNTKAWTWGYFEGADGRRVNGGSGNSNQHIFISAREAARFGWLFLNEGNWNGNQLISREWVKTATSVHVSASMEWIPSLSPFDGRGYYGFNWWRNGIGAEGNHKWPGAPDTTYAASGYNNNDLFVIPDWNMVIVRLGLDENDYKITDDDYGEFLRLVGLSLKED